MIPLDKAVIARLKKGELTFEIYVDPEKVRQFKYENKGKVDDFIAVRDIFINHSEGKKATNADLTKAFGTIDFDEAAGKIVEKGEIQLTTEQRRKMQEDRRKQVIELISRGAVDPRTHTPHPAARIEKALDEARIHIEPFKSAELQMEEALKAIKVIIPIKMERISIAVKVPAQYAGPASGFLKTYKKVREEWGSDGSYMGVVEMPAGLRPDFMDKLNRMTHGEVDAKITDIM